MTYTLHATFKGSSISLNDLEESAIGLAYHAMMLQGWENELEVQRIRYLEWFSTREQRTRLPSGFYTIFEIITSNLILTIYETKWNQILKEDPWKYP